MFTVKSPQTPTTVDQFMVLPRLGRAGLGGGREGPSPRNGRCHHVARAGAHAAPPPYMPPPNGSRFSCGRDGTYGAEAKTRTAQSMTLSTRTRSHRSQQSLVRRTRADREKIHSASLTARVRFLGERASPKYWTIALRKQTSLEVARSEEHTSELQSPCNLVCRLLLEKKKK